MNRLVIIQALPLGDSLIDNEGTLQVSDSKWEKLPAVESLNKLGIEEAKDLISQAVKVAPAQP